MTTCCAKPKPIEQAEDVFQMVLGVVVWIEGTTWTFCDACGVALTPTTRRTTAPEDA